MNGTLRRLMVGGLGALAIFWATRPSGAWAAAHVQAEKDGPAAASAADAGNEIKVTCGGSRSFQASSDIHRTHVADPEVVELIQPGSKEITVVGRKEGTTTITIWSAATRKPVTAVVHVVGKSAGSDPVGEVPAHAHADSQVKQVGLTATTAAATATPGVPIGAETNYMQQVPAVSIETSSPIMANVGKIVEQQILVKNVGSVTAEQVEVRGNVSIDSELISTDPKADIANSTLIWRFSKIPASGQQKIVVRVKPLMGGELSLHTNVSFKSSASIKVQVREPKLKLTCDGPAAVTVGSEVRIVLTLVNAGTGTAEAVKIRQVVPAVVQTGGHDPGAPGPLQIDVGTLEPGESRVLETVSVAREPGLVRVNLVAEGQDGVQTTAEHKLKVQAPKLALTTSGPDFRYLGRKATYQMVVSNPGDALAHNVNVVVALPEGLEFADASGDYIHTSEKRTVAWIIGVLEPGQKRELSVTVMPKSEGEHLQRIVAWGDNNLLAKADKLTRVEGLTELTMEVVDTGDPIELGSETTWQIHITNRGSKVAERIQVVATVPDGMKVGGAEGPGTYRVQGQQVVFEPVPSLAPQSSTVLELRVKGTKVGTHRLRAVMTCPSMSNAIITEEATQVYGD